MWVLGLLFISVVWAKKLDQPLYLPPNAAASGGAPGELEAPAPLPVVPVVPGHELPPKPIAIISYNNQPNNGDGTYSFSYETENGIKAQEEGMLKQDVPEGPGEVVHGSYSYTGTDGVVYTVEYTADERGFQAQGAHLPTPPPIPPEIQAALEQNALEEATATATPATDASLLFKAIPPSRFYHQLTANRPYYNQYNQYQRRY